MVNQEIIGGLKNALDRGESLEKAAQSFVNAGYNPNEIKEAVSQLSRNATNIISQSEKSKEISPQQNQQSKPIQTNQSKTLSTQQPVQNKLKTKEKVIQTIEKAKDELGDIVPKPKFHTKRFIIIFTIITTILLIGVIILFLAIPELSEIILDALTG